jgi:hypothetical protein
VSAASPAEQMPTIHSWNFRAFVDSRSRLGTTSPDLGRAVVPVMSLSANTSWPNVREHAAGLEKDVVGPPRWLRWEIAKGKTGSSTARGSESHYAILSLLLSTMIGDEEEIGILDITTTSVRRP